MGYDPIVNLYQKYNSASTSGTPDLQSFNSDALSSGVSDYLNDLIGANNVVGTAPGGVTWEQYNNWVASQHTSTPSVPTAAFDTDLAAYGIKPVAGYTPTAEDSLMAEYNKFTMPTEAGATYTPSAYGGPTGSTGWEQAYSDKIWTDGQTYKGMNYTDYIRSIWGGLAPSSQASYATQFNNEQAYQSQSNYDQYLNWLNGQGSAYNDAVNKNAALSAPTSAEIPKPFMPNGAPKTDDADLKIRVGDALARENGNQPVGLSPYSPLKSDWNGSYKFLGLDFADKSNPFSKLASQYDSPSFTGSGLLAQAMAKGMEGADPQKSSSNPWQSKNLIKPASYFDESSQGIEPPKGLMGQDMITQNNILPALQMAMLGSQNKEDGGNEAMEAATKPLTDTQGKMQGATDKIEEARNKWKSDSLNKFGNWQSLA